MRRPFGAMPGDAALAGRGAPAQANVGRAAAAFKADGSGKSGNAPPFVPMRALPRDDADTARPDVVVSPPGAVQPRPEGPPVQTGAAPKCRSLSPPASGPGEYTGVTDSARVSVI